jgi:O-antigen ligase
VDSNLSTLFLFMNDNSSRQPFWPVSILAAPEVRAPLGVTAIFATALLASLFYNGIHITYLGTALLLLLGWLGWTLWRGYAEGLTVSRTPITFWVSAFWSWLAVSLTWSTIAAADTITFWWLGTLPAVFWIYSLQPAREALWPYLSAVALTLAVALAMYACYQLIALGQPPRSFFLDIHSHAAFLGLVALPAIGHLLSRRGSLSNQGFLLLSGAVFLLVLAISITGGRGMMLSFSLALAVLLAVSFRRAPRRAIWLVLALTVVAYGFGNLLAQGRGVAKLATMLDPVTAGQTRFVIWQGAWRMILDAPWTGHGLGSFHNLYPAYRLPEDGSAGYMVHNDYLQLWVEVGLPAVLILLALYAAVALALVRLVRHEASNARVTEAAGLFGGLLLVAMHGAVNFNFYILPTLIVSGLILARFNELTQVGGGAGTFRWHPSRHFARIRYRVLLLLALSAPALYFVSIAVSDSAYRRAHQQAERGELLAAHRSFELAELFSPELDVLYVSHADLIRYLIAATPKGETKNRRALLREAEEMLDKAERLNPWRPIGFGVRGNLYTENADLVGDDWRDRALDNYRRAVRVNPRTYQGRHAGASLLLQTGQNAAAHAFLEDGMMHAYKETSSIIPYFALTARLRREAGDHEGAHGLEDRIRRIMDRAVPASVPAPTEIRLPRVPVS